MDILDELNLSSNFSNTLNVEEAFELPGEGLLKKSSAGQRSDTGLDIFDLKQATQDLPIEIKQIRVQKAIHPVVKVNQVKATRPESAAHFKPSIDYKKIFQDFNYFFETYPFLSLNNFKAAQKLFSTYFSSRRELPVRILEFKKMIDSFSHERDKFGKLSFDFKLKAHSLQITLERSRLKGVKQYISISFAENRDFFCYTQWNWKHKKEELIRSKQPYRTHELTKDSLVFDAKVWQAFNSTGIKRKNFIKSLDCLERNQARVIDFINAANKKSILNLIEPDLFSNVTLKSDNQDTMFINFRTNLHQRAEIRFTSFASSIVVVS